MGITPHMLVGAAIGSQGPNLWVVFSLGFISHFILDFLPHWDYLDTIKVDKPSHLIKIFLDVVLGSLLVLILIWFYPQNILMIMTGLVAVLLPDCLEFLYNTFRFRILRSFSLFHHRIHYAKKISFWKGAPSVIVVSLIALFVFIFL